MAQQQGMNVLAPEVVRLLPAGDITAFVDLAPLRKAQKLTFPSSKDPDYATFVHDSGFEFERDLDQLGLSMSGSPADPDRTTAILRGRFGPSFWKYLQLNSIRQSTVAGYTAYEFQGWRHPEKHIQVMPMASGLVVISNGSDLDAVARRHNHWWMSAAPAFWPARPWFPRPLGFLAVDAGRLSAERELGLDSDSWGFDLRGSQWITGSILPIARGGLVLQLNDQTLAPEDAVRIRSWADQQLTLLRRALPSDSSGAISLHSLLDGVHTSQRENLVLLNLRLDVASLRRLSQP